MSRSPKQLATQERIAKQEVENTPLALKVLKHWREFRPRMCRGLERRGKLYQAVWAAATRTADLLVNLTRQGMNYDRAQELAFREWYLLPDEKERPELTFDPASLEPVPTGDEEAEQNPGQQTLLPTPETSA